MRTRKTCAPFSFAASIFLAAAFAMPAHGQGLSIKPGLWQSDSTVTSTMALPPEVEARMAAMPPAQQAQMRAMMPGAAGGKPMTATSKSCIASGMTLDSFLNQQQNRPGMRCTFTNRTQTSDGAAFDTSCILSQGTGTGHTQIHLIDADHATSSTHMTIDASSNGHTMHSTSDSTSSIKYLGADCGDVKPYVPPAGH